MDFHFVPLKFKYLEHLICSNTNSCSVLMKRVPQTADAISLCGENPSLLAVGEGQSRCIERLLSGNLKSVSMRAMQRDINGTSILMAAVAREDNDTALWLLRTFGKPLAMLPNSCRMLPLHVAASTGKTWWIFAIFHGLECARTCFWGFISQHLNKCVYLHDYIGVTSLPSRGGISNRKRQQSTQTHGANFGVQLEWNFSWKELKYRTFGANGRADS